MVYTVLVAIVLVVILAASFLTRFGFRQITQMKLQTYENIFDYLEKTGIYSRERFETLDKRK